VVVGSIFRSDSEVRIGVQVGDRQVTGFSPLIASIQGRSIYSVCGLFGSCTGSLRQ
jgi:hypothetical protein